MKGNLSLEIFAIEDIPRGLKDRGHSYREQTQALQMQGHWWKVHQSKRDGRLWQL